MPARPARGHTHNERIDAPRIVVALLCLAPLAMRWIARHPSLTRGPTIGLLTMSTVMTLLQATLIILVLFLGVLGALPPWFGTTLLVLLLAIGVTFAGAIFGSYRATPAAAWRWSAGGLIMAIVLFTLLGKPFQTVQAAAFRLPLLLAAHAMTEDDENYFTIGNARPKVDPLDLRAFELADDAKTQAFTMRGCTVRIEEPLREYEDTDERINLTTSRAHVGIMPAEPLTNIIEGGAPGFRPMPPAVRNGFADEHAFALHEAMYGITYDDVRAARTLDELVKRESLYALKVFQGLPPPVQRFESDGVRGFFSTSNERAAADVFDAEGKHRIDVRVVAMDVFADEDLLREELLRILSTLRCDE